jgi:hypothetical protein
MSVLATPEMAWHIVHEHTSLPKYVYETLRLGDMEKWTLKAIVQAAEDGNSYAFKLMINSDVFFFHNSIVFEEYLNEAIRFATKGDISAFEIMMINIPVGVHVNREDAVKLMTLCHDKADQPNLLEFMKIVASSQGIKPSIPSIFRFMMYKAAVQRNLEVVDFLLSCGIPWDDKCVWAASCTGDIDFLVWIHNRGFHIDVNMILNAGLVL